MPSGFVTPRKDEASWSGSGNVSAPPAESRRSASWKAVVTEALRVTRASKPEPLGTTAIAPIDANVGVGAWADVPGGVGAAADDGFTGYRQQVFPNPIRSRWGDYGAAAVDGNSVWIASEYIAHTCNYTDWGGPFFTGGSGDNLLGTCGGASHGPGTRSALANWSTRISEYTP